MKQLRQIFRLTHVGEALSRDEEDGLSPEEKQERVPCLAVLSSLAWPSNRWKVDRAVTGETPGWRSYAEGHEAGSHPALLPLHAAPKRAGTAAAIKKIEPRVR